MKMRALLRSLLTSRRTALLFGCSAVGLVGGLVAAVILFSRAKPVYESYALIHLTRPPDVGEQLSDREWLEQEATVLRDRKLLERAAVAARMDSHRGLSVPQCGDILEESVSVALISIPVSTIMSDAVAKVEYDAAGLTNTCIKISMTGPSPMECAHAVKAMVDEREHYYQKVALQRLQENPDYREWAALAKRVTSLTAEVAARRSSLLLEMEQFGKPAASLSEQEMLDLSPPQLVMATHTAYRKAAMELTVAKQRMEASSQYASIACSFLVLEQPRPSAVAAGPKWLPFGAGWGINGTVTGLAAGLLLAFRKPRDPHYDTALPVPVSRF